MTKKNKTKLFYKVISIETHFFCNSYCHTSVFAVKKKNGLTTKGKHD